MHPSDLHAAADARPAELRGSGRPVLVLARRGRRVLPARRLRGLRRRLAGRQVAIVEGTDHYLWRREREAAALVGDFVDGALASSAR